MITTNITNVNLQVEEGQITNATVFLNANIGFISLAANVPLNNESGYNLNELTPKQWFDKAKEEFVKELTGGIE
ncbi:hypothetical protein [Enterococcus cecorum]|uniref:hypothetical protein n=1 Tax=Enterococcus cecorum TaxID=44008 RepID=UPI00148C57E9|nr:hypothetical protein [Enterococcus cecorum]